MLPVTSLFVAFKACRYKRTLRKIDIAKEERKDFFRNNVINKGFIIGYVRLIAVLVQR